MAVKEGQQVKRWLRSRSKRRALRYRLIANEELRG